MAVLHRVTGYVGRVKVFSCFYLPVERAIPPCGSIFDDEDKAARSRTRTRKRSGHHTWQQATKTRTPTKATATATTSKTPATGAKRAGAHRQLFREKILLVQEEDDAGPLEEGVAADALEQHHRFTHPERDMRQKSARGGRGTHVMRARSRTTSRPSHPYKCRDGARRVFTDQADTARTNREASWVVR